MAEISSVKNIVTGKIVQKLQGISQKPIEVNESSPIGMFDSGVGGLTVLRQLQKDMPKENVIYLADTARLPFGGRPRKEIININYQILNHLVGLGVKMVIMACGTSSAVAYPVVKDKYKVPIISMIPYGAKAAAAVTKNRKIGVIATVSTVGSHAYQKAIKDINQDMQVYEAACPLFVPLIEGGFIESEETVRVAKEYLAPLIKAGIDTLILGCTHFPHLIKMIEVIVGSAVTIVDPAEETIKDVKQQLLRSNLASQLTSPPAYEYLVTGNAEVFASLGSKLLGRPIPGVKQITLAVK